MEHKRTQPGMRILITGGGGYLGYHSAIVLAAAGNLNQDLK